MYVTLNPVGAVTAGALWNLDGGAWQSSGSLLSSVLTGAHTINFNSVIGWTSPSSQSINVTAGNTYTSTGTYTQTPQYGAVYVTLNPVGAVTAGAQWNLDGGAWQTSGSLLSNVLTGAHTINFNSVTGWTSPSSQSITVTDGITYNTNGTYIIIPPPITYRIDVYNKISGNSQFNWEKLLETATTYVPASQHVKICADGSNATIIKINCDDPGMDMRDIKFRIVNDPFGLDADFYGKFYVSDYSSIFSLGQVKYTHPFYTTNSIFLRTENIEAYNSITNQVVLTIPIRLYPAPVLFVHGLWGSPSAFDEMDQNFIQSLLYTPELTWCANYSNDNSESFETNEFVVRDELNVLFGNLRFLNYSCGKANVVAHSMGGILSRLYLQSIGYRNDLRTLITINTPHSGSQGANYLLSHWCTMQRSILNAWPPGYYTNNGAVGNLQAHSWAIDNWLNGYSSSHGYINKNIVPSFTYTSTSTPSIGGTDWYPITGSYNVNANIFNNNGILNKTDLINRIFNYSQSDAVVPLESQDGGMVLTDNNNPVNHTDNEKQSNLINALRAKFSTNPKSSANFNQNGFSPNTLGLDAYLCSPGNPIINSSIENILLRTNNLDSIIIYSPINGSSYNSGDTLHISVQGYGDVTYVMFILAGDNISPVVYDTTYNQLIVDYIIPTNAIGEINIISQASDGNGNVVYDSASIFLNSQLTLDSIKFDLSYLSCQWGANEQLNVKGYFNDSIIIDISSQNGMQYIVLDTTVAFLDGVNTVYGINSGLTQVVANYQGYTDTVLLEVYVDSTNLYSACSVSSNVVCLNDTAKFQQNSSGIPTSWLWSFPGGNPNNSTSPNPTVVYGSPGYHNISLISYWGNLSDTINLVSYINVNAIDTSISNSGNILTSNSDSSHYLWFNCSGFPVFTDSINKSFSPSYDGSFAVIISKNGCIDTSQCHDILGVGIKDLKGNEQFIVYPNPTTNMINIRGHELINSDVELILENAMGQQITLRKIKIVDSTLDLNLDLLNFSSGIYKLLIVSDRYINKFIIQKL